MIRLRRPFRLRFRSHDLTEIRGGNVVPTDIGVSVELDESATVHIDRNHRAGLVFEATKASRRPNDRDALPRPFSLQRIDCS